MPYRESTLSPEDQSSLVAFNICDQDKKGYLTRTELQDAIEQLTDQEFRLDQIEALYGEFDKDGTGKVDFPEFKTLIKHLKEAKGTLKTNNFRRGSLVLDDLESFNPFGESFGSGGNNKVDLGMSVVLNKAIKNSRRESTTMLKKVAREVYAIRDMLCIQDDILEKVTEEEEAMDENNHRSMALDFDMLFDGLLDSATDVIPEEEEFEESSNDWGAAPETNPMDPEFRPAFSPSDMRCLALVSHNGMKKTMREFVTANKNLLKCFRLTGTNSTMTMLKEVFKDEPAGTVVFGPACASGPLGGDAELVAYMVSGKIGGVIFFQDPMDSHPHRADIDCLVRQALVHNVMMCQTPTSALMIVNCLRQALVAKGKPELIPSFFFSLQSPTVEAYKSQQKAVVDKQKAEAAAVLANAKGEY